MKHSPAYRLAATVLHGFDEYRARFQQITQDASRRFRDAAWREAQQASAARINLYGEKVQDTLGRLQRTFPQDVLAHCETWREARRHYANLIGQRLDYELAETFFNSLFCSVFEHRHIRNDWMFVYSSREDAAHRSGIELCRRHAVNGDWAGALAWALQEAPLETPFAHLERDSQLGAGLLEAQLPARLWQAADARVELLNSVFYRNKGAYLVGRILGGGEQVPLVLPILHGEGYGEQQGGDPRLHLDTVLTETDEVSIIFSFTRAYFQVDVPVPGEFVGYLKQLMPHKPEGELYAAIGFFKHGKTEFFRALNQQVAKREERFIIAPGVRGMVMAVFVLPSFRTVFKIIKDKFDPAKEVTPAIVREKYRLVKRHDRVGRMADTQEFSNFIVRQDHFAPECLAHLLEVAPSTVSLKGDKVIIKHCYTERMMTPLNLYLEQCSTDERVMVLKDYGNAIKQMAAANIFPGDMLLKNFGVTRHGRVIFYDYDEVSYLTECRFRHMPKAQQGDSYMDGGASLSIGPHDIFPEEFGPFMFANPELRALFMEQHPELFDPDYWLGLQQAIRNGRVIDVYPYRNKQRFSGTSGHLGIHDALEAALAEWTGRERALLFSTGYMANLGVLQALADSHTAIFQDRLNHASLLDGAALSGARSRRYHHRDGQDLARLLARSRATHQLVVSDGVFSMDGDIADIEQLAHLSQQHGAWLMIDDAHGLGVLGENGAGCVAGFNSQQVPILVGTLGKALGTAGAFVAGDAALIEHLIQFSRSYVYTTAQPPGIAAATLEALTIVQREPEHRQRLARHIDYFRQQATALGLPLGHSHTPIQPLLLGSERRTMAWTTRFDKHDIQVGAIRPPTVPNGEARLRITLSARHTQRDIDRLLDVAATCLHKEPR